MNHLREIKLLVTIVLRIEIGLGSLVEDINPRKVLSAILCLQLFPLHALFFDFHSQNYPTAFVMMYNSISYLYNAKVLFSVRECELIKILFCYRFSEKLSWACRKVQSVSYYPSQSRGTCSVLKDASRLFVCSYGCPIVTTSRDCKP